MSTKMKSLDDVIPVGCLIESSYNFKDHTEYSIRVTFGPVPETSWKITKRYSDFSALDAVLRTYGIDLPLPPKKVFGKMDAEFVAHRQQALQIYLQEMLRHPWIVSSLDLKLFLCSNGAIDSKYQETANQNVSMLLRSENQWEMLESLTQIGWRTRKCFVMVKDKLEPKEKFILTWCLCRPGQSVGDKDLEQTLKLLSTVQHPGIEPVHFTTCSDTCSVVIRKFHEVGTIRDQLCHTKPGIHYMKKYASPKNSRYIQLSDIRSIGRQVLDTLKFLQSKGYPFVHVHAGNVIVDNNNRCKLLDLENWAVGVPHNLYPLFVQLRKLQTIEAIQVYTFGHFLYEMATGRPLSTPTFTEVPGDSSHNITPEFKILLDSILSPAACKSNLPSISDLLKNPFFSEVILQPNDNIQFKVPSKLKELFKMSIETFEHQLNEEQLQLHQHKRMVKAQAFHMSAEEKKKRRVQKVLSLQDNGVRDAQEQQNGQLGYLSLASIKKQSSVAPPDKKTMNNSETITNNQLHTENNDSPILSPKKSIHSPVSSPELPGKDEGRQGVLTSIVGFNKSRLKKAETIDKSVPKI